MKKALSFVLALALTLGMAACSSGTSSESSSSGSVSSEAAGSSQAEESGSSSDPAAESAASEEAGAESDLAYVKDKGSLVVGITYFDPMDYKEEGSDEWIGFDADMAKAFAESLGVEAEFIEITWDYKVEELNSKAIDAVWNGMTLTDEVKSAMATSNPYCTNYQVLVFPADKAADFEGLTSLEGLNVAVESGSAGEDAAVALNATTVAVQSQANALMEVSASTADAAVIDVLMAAAMTGEGTSYQNLSYSLNLNEAQGLESEEYGVGFRQGSDLVDAFNTFWGEKVADGTVQETAAAYGLQDAVILE